MQLAWHKCWLFSGVAVTLSLEVVGKEDWELVVEYTGLSQAATVSRGAMLRDAFCEEHPLTVWRSQFFSSYRMKKFGGGALESFEKVRNAE